MARALNFKKQHGPPLQSAGYSLVPIKVGEKHPATRGWQDLESTDELVARWGASSYYGGLGCLGKVTPGIDIDVYDKAAVDKVVAWCHEHIGVTPIRIGNAPRVLLPCAAPSGGLGPDNSAKYEDEFGSTHQIEIKATGQQWVAYGVHPKTGNAYKWDGAELHETEADFLPVLTGGKIDALFKFFDSLAEAEGWAQMGKGRSRSRTGGLDKMGQVVGADPFENYAPPINISVDDLERMLFALDPDANYDGIGWRTIGMALYHQFEGSDEGKGLYRSWSEDSADYDFDEIEARWPSFDQSTYRGRPVTAATIVGIYNDVVEVRGESDSTLRRKPKKLADWCKRFALVELQDGTDVHDCGVPVHMAPKRTLRAFKEHNAAYLHHSLGMDGEVTIELMVDAWKSSHDTRHYAGYIYNPGEGRFCRNPSMTDDDSMYVNTFYWPPHPVPKSGTAVQNLYVFMEFIEHLFPEAEEREWFLMWLARMVQRPTVRSFVTPINITPITGTGRGLLFEILRQVVGGHNAHDVSKDDMEGRFNGFLDKCVLAVVQEIKAATGEHKYQMWERMKSLLADTTANIQSKGKDSYTAPVYANFLMFSNNLDALPIDDINERRIYAMRGATSPISLEHIDRVNAWREKPDNLAALFHYLNELKVDDSKFKRAPVSKTKIQMVAASLGEERDDFNTWLRDTKPKVLTYDYAMAQLTDFDDGMGGATISNRQFGKMLAERGYHQTRIRSTNGNRVRVYFDAANIDDDPTILREELEMVDDSI